MFEASHIHPMLVHFPIALIMAGFLFDVIFLVFKKEQCLSKAGLYLMILGTLGAGVALASGYLFTNAPSDGEVVNVYNSHRTGALVTTIIMFISSIVRVYIVTSKKEETSLKWVSFGLYLLGAVAVSFTGFMGGTMVYKYFLGL
jgi:uncharacterized membrane protein